MVGEPSEREIATGGRAVAAEAVKIRAAMGASAYHFDRGDAGSLQLVTHRGLEVQVRLPRVCTRDDAASRRGFGHSQLDVGTDLVAAGADGRPKPRGCGRGHGPEPARDIADDAGHDATPARVDGRDAIGGRQDHWNAVRRRDRQGESRAFGDEGVGFADTAGGTFEAACAVNLLQPRNRKVYVSGATEDLGALGRLSPADRCDLEGAAAVPPDRIASEVLRLLCESLHGRRS